MSTENTCRPPPPPVPKGPIVQEPTYANIRLPVCACAAPADATSPVPTSEMNSRRDTVFMGVDYGLIKVPALRVAHLDLAGRKIFFPPSRDKFRDVLTTCEFLRESRLQSRIDGNRCAIRDVIAHDTAFRRMNVGARLESRKRRPEEVDGARRRTGGLVGDDDKRPILEHARRSDPRGGIGLRGERCGTDHKTAGTEHMHLGHAL